MLYTFGYQGQNPDSLQAWLEIHNAVLYDIRFVPRSRDYRWSQRALMERLGERYIHLTGFGNRNYKRGPITLVNPADAIRIVEAVTEDGVLMCVCRDERICHRAVVADLLRQRGYEVKPLDLT